MDWLRRNWPDLLIGVALVAVIAGIIATLVSGGSFFPVGNRTAETPRPTQGITAGQTAGQTQTEPAQTQSGAQSAEPGATQPDAPATSSASSSLSSSAAGQEPPAVPVEPAGSSAASASVDEPAASPASSQSSTVEALPPEPGSQSAASTVTSSAAQTASQTSAVSQPASRPTTPPAAASSDDEAPYRVSVGAFGNPENAQRQLEAFEDAGYPVFIGTQGDLNIVLVGPYDTESEARSVASRIAGANLGVSDPTVYRFEPDEDGATSAQSTTEAATSTPAPAASQPTQTQPASQPAQAATPTTQPTQAAEPSASPGTRYLQVGAYGSRESSQPQRERLEGMGFVVSDRVEGDLVKLLIGPFDAGQLGEAQDRLQAAGIESFPR